MNEKNCPNCGNALGAEMISCTCGYDFTDDEIAVPPPGIVRSGGTDHDQHAAAGAMVMKAAPAPSPASSPASSQAPRTARPIPRQAAPALRPNEALIMACPACDARISRRAQHCPKCGVSPYDHCQVCAQRILAGTAPCPECGDPAPFDVARAG